MNNHRWVEVKGKVNSKMYLIAEQLEDVNSVQKRIIQTQKNHTMVLMKAVDIIQNNSRALMACSQLFYARDQMLQVQASLLGSFSALINELKMYRVAIYSYKLTILNSVMIMVNKLIPMAILPRSDLEEILRDVNYWQSDTNERLSLAIPITQILTYYETKVLRNVDIVDNGMYFTLAIPFTAATVLNLYKAVPMPMPNDGTDGHASLYAIEADFIAVSSTQKIALLSQDEINRCVGSSSLSVCINGFSLETAQDTCLGSLLINNHLTALQKCEIKTVKLPLKEKARNLGNGKWFDNISIIEFQNVFKPNNKHDPLKRTALPGCQVCIIELQCGTKLETNFLEIRADMFSCHNTSLQKLDIKLTDPLKHLSKVPAIDNLPHFATITQARQQFIEEIQIQMSEIPDHQRPSLNKLDEIAQPILMDMQSIRPSLKNRFTQSDTWKMSVIIGTISFIISVILHSLINYVCQKYGRRYAKMRKFVVGSFGIHPRRILVVTEDEKQTLMLQPGNRLTAENIVITDKQLSKILGPTAPQREELSHVIQPSYDVDFFCQHLANSLKSA